MIDKCFEYDWNCMKDPAKYCKAFADQVKDEMRPLYKLLKENYRVQAGYSPCGNVFAVGQGQIGLFYKDVLQCIDEEQPDGGLCLN